MAFRNYMTNTDEEVAVELIRGRWYIKMGFAGFNSGRNNFDGWASKVGAESAIHHYQLKGAR